MKQILGRWLRQCQIKSFAETATGTVPPSRDEVVELISYLNKYKLDPTIVGSAAVLLHVKDPNFRPTHDVDIHINKEALPPLLPGWRVDKEATGTLSWISPSGGYVDFLYPSYQFPSGEAMVKIDKQKEGELPLADVASIFRMKLNSFRGRDFSDLAGIVRVIGHFPSEKELGKLNETQKENLEFLKQWIAAKEKRKT